MDGQLPHGWSTTTVGELARYVNGRAFKPAEWKTSGKPIIRIQNLNNPDANYNFSNIDHEEKYIVKHRDLLFAWSASLGAHIWKGEDAWLNQHIFNVIPNPGVDKYYLYYLLTRITAELYAKAHGSGMVHVTKGKFEATEVYLPPTNEQKRIVAKIEELFSELDNGIAALKTAREQLKVYRQAVLKHAFEGKLTAQWREDNKDKLETPEQLLARIQQEREARYQQQLEEWKQAVRAWEANGKKGRKPAKPKAHAPLEVLADSEVQELCHLPLGWGFFRLGDFISRIDAGKSFKCEEREPFENEIGVAKVSAVTWGEYDESESKTCVDRGKVNSDYFVQEGDFLLSRANTIDLVGACVIAKTTTKNIMLSDKTLRLNFVGINRRFVLHYLRSHYGRKEIMGRSTGNQESMRNIGQDRIKSIVLPVCPPEEMGLLVEVVNSKLESTSNLEQEIETQLLKLESLRQSILKKAFSGQLVPQDPNDEPASELLARIKAEKAVTVAAARTKPARRKKPASKRRRRVKEDANA